MYGEMFVNVQSTVAKSRIRHRSRTETIRPAAERIY